VGCGAVGHVFSGIAGVGSTLFDTWLGIKTIECDVSMTKTTSIQEHMNAFSAGEGPGAPGPQADIFNVLNNQPRRSHFP
jgi:hypothetical protein